MTDQTSTFVPKGFEIAGSVSAEEAAAMVAAVEQFLAETSPVAAPQAVKASGWQMTARYEAVGDTSSAWWSPWG